MHILVATDGSERAERAVEAALVIGAGLRARLTFLTVVPPSPPRLAHRWDGLARPDPDQEIRAEWVLSNAEARAWGEGISTDARLVVEDLPHRAIMVEAERLGCDMIVMGSRGAGAEQGSGAMGREAGEVLRASPIPVLIAR